MYIEGSTSTGSSFAALKRLWAQMSQSARVGMWAMLALGIFLRAFRLDTFEFKGDELKAIREGLSAPAHHWWIEHGMQSSVGIPNGPVFSYIMGLLTAGSADPYTLTAFFLAVNIVVLLLSVLFFATFARDRVQFLLCLFLFSLSPYLILFSRKIWAQNLLLLFVIPLVLMILRVREKPHLFLPIGLFASIAFQLHHSGVFYVILLVCFAAASFKLAANEPAIRAANNRPKTTLLWAAGGFIAFLLPLVPYVSFFFHRLQQTGVAQWAARGPNEFFKIGALQWIVFTATGNHFWTYLLSGSNCVWSWPAPPFPGVVLIFCYFLALPFLLGFFSYAKAAVQYFRPASPGPAGGSDLKDLLCPLSIGYLFLIYCILSFVVHPHHYTILLPFLVLALSEGILLLHEYGKPWRSPVRVLLFAGLISYALQYPFVLSYVDANNGATGEYGICYREQRHAAQRIAASAGSGKVRFNPAEAASEDFSMPYRWAELQNTIAYICRVEFGAKVLFNGSAEPGARELKLHHVGSKLELEIE
ncbi:MAG: hypothetical protein ACLQSW_08385 [Syntrophobacteraceae bacterium]